MSKLDLQNIRNLKADDSAYGDSISKKRIVQKDKSQKHRTNFKIMSVKDLTDILDNEEEDDIEFDCN